MYLATTKLTSKRLYTIPISIPLINYRVILILIEQYCVYYDNVNY